MNMITLAALYALHVLFTRAQITETLAQGIHNNIRAITAACRCMPPLRACPLLSSMAADWALLDCSF